MRTNKSIGDFKAFLETLNEIPELNGATARNLRNTSNLLLNCYVDGEILTDDDRVEHLDVDAVVDYYVRFSNQNPSPSTVQVYKSRLSSALEKFKSKFSGDDRMSTERNLELSDSLPSTRRRIRAERDFSQSVAVLNKDLRGDSETIDIPIPLRPGLILTIPSVPTDLTNEEAERIASILKVYARP
ncbi:hypothetical protein [Pantoea allii]|uniref:hypothetical protein n=1 Tax=Pantoea allii TaxID=574096 RepID=UPI0024B6993E|nr:hypothetical protein [Pantoea allii]MDJ0087716.1 hypothetical protein [Pantoea allii]